MVASSPTISAVGVQVMAGPFRPGNPVRTGADVGVDGISGARAGGASTRPRSRAARGRRQARLIDSPPSFDAIETAWATVVPAVPPGTPTTRCVRIPTALVVEQFTTPEPESPGDAGSAAYQAPACCSSATPARALVGNVSPSPTPLPYTHTGSPWTTAAELAFGPPHTGTAVRTWLDRPVGIVTSPKSWPMSVGSGADGSSWRAYTTA